MAVWPSERGSVNEMSVSAVAAAETFCTIMSMLIWASASARKMAAASPTLSGTPTTVILASLRSWATPQMMACSMSGSFRTSSLETTHVPGRSLNDERTWMGMSLRRAYSTHRRCRILAPLAVISSVSS